MNNVTIIIAYDDNACEHYVGVVEGELSSEEKTLIQAQLSDKEVSFQFVPVNKSTNLRLVSEFGALVQYYIPQVGD